MNNAPQPSHQVRAHAHRHAGFALSGAALRTNKHIYTCATHPEIAREAPHECPHCGSKLLPIRHAIAQAVLALKSLSAVTKSLRLYQI